MSDGYSCKYPSLRYFSQVAEHISFKRTWTTMNVAKLCCPCPHKTETRFLHMYSIPNRFSGKCQLWRILSVFLKLCNGFENLCVFLCESVKCCSGVYLQWQDRKKTQHQASNIQRELYPVKLITHTCTRGNSISIHETIFTYPTQQKMFTLVNTWREAPFSVYPFFLYSISHD